MVESPQRIWIEANDECPYFYEAHELHDVEQDVIEYVRADLYAALEAQLAERTVGVNEDALRALAQAYDREDAAQRGEPDPWNLDDPGDIGDSDTWVSERLGCARAAAEAFLAALKEASNEQS